MLPVRELLEERKATHGDFKNTAFISQRLKSVIMAGENYDGLHARQREALDMICSKIGRIVSGDPNHKDHWEDIAGYAKLADGEKRLSNPSPWKIIDKEFNEKMTQEIDDILCKKYNLSKGYFMRLQKAYDEIG
jgi:hypothetical protein